MVAGGSYGGKYIMNVFDLQGKISYTVYEIKGNDSIQFDSKEGLLMWIGEKRKNGEVPAWCFKVDNK